MAPKSWFENKFEDYSKEASSELLNSQDVISDAFMAKLQNYKTSKIGILTTQLEANIFYDSTVYTGSAGLALYYLMAALKKKEQNHDLLLSALPFINIDDLRGRRISFLCGDAGPLAVATVISYKLDKKRPDTLPDYKSLAQRLMSLASLLNDSPDEMLYGRAGYLYSLLFVNKHVGNKIIPSNHIEKVISMILKSGRQLSIQIKWPSVMMWQWHDKLYFGGAHGAIGIIYILLQAIQYYNVLDLRNYVKPSLDCILEQQFPDGNFPSSYRSSSGDRLVQWCHGAPGFVAPCLLAYEIFGEEKYLSTALKCGEVVWRRGLCTKGYSLCHGVAGNAYTFIDLYRATNDPTHLYRACCFMEWCMAEQDGTEMHSPDRPASLFEGLLGRIYLAEDLTHVTEAAFPAYAV